jgi:hypothetical protein
MQIEQYFGSVGELCRNRLINFKECKMTAIAAVLAPWGVLLAADGRVGLSGVEEPITDFAQKISAVQISG